MKYLPTALIALAGSAIALASPAKADVIFTGSGTLASNSVAASATFAISGTTLTIKLENTSTANSQEAPGSTLSGLSFTLNGLDPVLTPGSAVSPNAIVNSSFCNDHPCGGTNVNVGGEWGYQNNYGPGGTLEAVGSAGYITTGLAGDLGNFNGQDLQNPDSLDGIEFGVISATHGGLNGGLAGQALIDDTVILTLTIPSGITEAQIGNVSFLYGTSAGEGTVGGGGGHGGQEVPEPASLAAIGTALVAFVGFAATRRRWWI